MVDLFEQYDQYAAQEENEIMNSCNQEIMNLDRFHIVDGKGHIKGVFDWAIFQFLTETQDLFVLGGVPYIYDGGVYVPDENGSRLKTLIRGCIYPEFIKSTTIKRVYDLFIGAAELQAKYDDLNQYPAHWVNFKNGFYDPVARVMIPHDPKYKAMNQIPHCYNPGGDPQGDAVEEWLRFIVPDQDDREMLMQFAGYSMTRDVRQQKFLILNGEGGTGKSTDISDAELEQIANAMDGNAMGLGVVNDFAKEVYKNKQKLNPEKRYLFPKNYLSMVKGDYPIEEMEREIVNMARACGKIIESDGANRAAVMAKNFQEQRYGVKTDRDTLVREKIASSEQEFYEGITAIPVETLQKCLNG